MGEHFSDATKKVDFIRRDEVHVQIERALCDGLPYHRAIDEIPAADVRPVVRGEWWPAKDGYYGHVMCSVCHKIESHITDFCPNCGADMRPNLDTTKGDNHD